MHGNRSIYINIQNYSDEKVFLLYPLAGGYRVDLQTPKLQSDITESEITKNIESIYKCWNYTAILDVKKSFSGTYRTKLSYFNAAAADV